MVVAGWVVWSGLFCFWFGDGLGCFLLVVLGRVVFGLTTGSRFEIQDREFG
jgi:hypothetical protein